MNESIGNIRSNRSNAPTRPTIAPVVAPNDDIVPARAFAGSDSHPLKRAFARPSGLLGRLAGWIMSVTNTPLIEYAVRLLKPRPGDRVLEIGFGPGTGIGLLIDCVGETGFVAGLDPSEQMLGINLRRFKRPLSSGRLRLEKAAADRIPWPDDSFDRVLCVSAVQFWKPASRSFSETFRVLKGGGLLVLGIHTQVEGRRAKIPGLFPEEVTRLVKLLENAGFAYIAKHPMQGGKAGLCIVARRPGQVAPT